MAKPDVIEDRNKKPDDNLVLANEAFGLTNQTEKGFRPEFKPLEAGTVKSVSGDGMGEHPEEKAEGAKSMNIVQWNPRMATKFGYDANNKLITTTFVVGKDPDVVLRHLNKEEAASRVKPGAKDSWYPTLNGKIVGEPVSNNDFSREHNTWMLQNGANGTGKLFILGQAPLQGRFIGDGTFAQTDGDGDITSVRRVPLFEKSDEHKDLRSPLNKTLFPTINSRVNLIYSVDDKGNFIKDPTTQRKVYDQFNQLDADGKHIHSWTRDKKTDNFFYLDASDPSAPNGIKTIYDVSFSLDQPKQIPAAPDPLEIARRAKAAARPETNKKAKDETAPNNPAVRALPKVDITGPQIKAGEKPEAKDTKAAKPEKAIAKIESSVIRNAVGALVETTARDMSVTRPDHSIFKAHLAKEKDFTSINKLEETNTQGQAVTWMKKAGTINDFEYKDSQGNIHIRRNLQLAKNGNLSYIDEKDFAGNKENSITTIMRSNGAELKTGTNLTKYTFDDYGRVSREQPPTKAIQNGAKVYNFYYVNKEDETLAKVEIQKRLSETSWNFVTLKRIGNANEWKQDCSKDTWDGNSRKWVRQAVAYNHPRRLTDKWPDLRGSISIDQYGNYAQKLYATEV